MKENVKMNTYIYICITGTLCCILKTNVVNQLCFNNKKNNEILPFAATWIHLEGLIVSLISQTEKDKYI